MDDQNYLLTTPVNQYIGKTIVGVETDSLGSGIHMSDRVVIKFTDGTQIVLRTDWRGSDCYISQYVR